MNTHQHLLDMIRKMGFVVRASPRLIQVASGVHSMDGMEVLQEPTFTLQQTDAQWHVVLNGRYPVRTAREQLFDSEREVLDFIARVAPEQAQVA